VKQAIPRLVLTILVLSVSVAPARAALILNEALANEPGSATSLEWVEILNWPDTGLAISLSGYKYLDGGQTTTLDTEIAIPAGGFAILARKTTGASSFEERWGNASGVWGDRDSESYPVIAVTQMSLRNSSDTIRLVSPSGDTSTVLWRSDSGDGISIERIRPGANDSIANFTGCRDAGGSTPARHNSVIPTRGDLRLDSVRVVTATPEWGLPVSFWITITNVGFGTVSGASLSIIQLNAPELNDIATLDIPDLAEESTLGLEHVWYSPPPGVSRLMARINQDADSTNNSTTATLTVRFALPQIVISEYLANPAFGGPDEWVEIINLAAFPISLEGVRIGDSLNTEVIPSPERAISPSEFWIVAESEIAFRAFYPQFSGEVIHIAGWRALNNTGDGIRLIGPSGEIIDSLTFRAVYPGNRSIERVELTPSFATPTDWTGSVDPVGATPGMPNSVVRGEPGQLSIDSIWIDPPVPRWGDTIRVRSALSNKSFGPAAGFRLDLFRDLDFASPGAQLVPIGQTEISGVAEGESTISEFAWPDAPPGIHRLHIVLRDDDDLPTDTSALITTIRFSVPLIIISEYMAVPGSSGSGEWIELYNASDIPLSLRGVKIGDSSGIAGLPPSLSTLDPESFLIVAQDEDQFRSFYSEFGGDVITIPGWRTLNDTGDRIRLIGPGDEIIDSVSYADAPRMNRSTERRGLIPDFADPRDWGYSIDPSGATPGRSNSIRRLMNDLAIDSMRPFHPIISFGEVMSGTIWVRNSGFSPTEVSSVLVSAENGAVIERLTLPVGPFGINESQAIPFALSGLPPGALALFISVPQDDYDGNNHAPHGATVRYTSPTLIVSEFLANPETDGPGEWIELYNTLDIPLVLLWLRIGDSSGLETLGPSISARIGARSYCVLAQDEFAFRGFYGDFDGLLREVPNWRELNNTGDAIRLAGRGGETIDSVTYVTVYQGNHSSERLSLLPALSTTEDWAESVDPSGATPGRPNSVNAAAAGQLQVHVSPNPVFRSAGQTARIDYRLEIGERLTLKFFDRAGRLVRTIADDVPSATGFVEWDGTDDDGYALRPGPYVLLARSEPTGSTKKLVVVIAP
jgi:hypothetical protein